MSGIRQVETMTPPVTPLSLRGAQDEVAHRGLEPPPSEVHHRATWRSVERLGNASGSERAALPAEWIACGWEGRTVASLLGGLVTALGELEGCSPDYQSGLRRREVGIRK
jgi:hypothetical protein